MGFLMLKKKILTQIPLMHSLQNNKKRELKHGKRGTIEVICLSIKVW